MNSTAGVLRSTTQESQSEFHFLNIEKKNTMAAFESQPTKLVHFGKLSNFVYCAEDTVASTSEHKSTPILAILAIQNGAPGCV